MRIKKIGLVGLMMILAMLLFTVSAQASSTVPQNLRGHWSTLRGNELWTFTFRKSSADLFTKGPHESGNTSKIALPVHGKSVKYWIKGYGVKKLRTYGFTGDIDDSFIPFKLKVAGAYRHVLLSPMQWGHSFAIYTKFVPTKMYTIRVKTLG